jgi:hypothetical protein
VTYLKNRFKHPDLAKHIRELLRLGLVREEDRLRGRAATAGVEKRIVPAPNSVSPDKLTAAQAEVVRLVRSHGEFDASPSVGPFGTRTLRCCRPDSQRHPRYPGRRCFVLCGVCGRTSVDPGRLFSRTRTRERP